MNELIATFWIGFKVGFLRGLAKGGAVLVLTLEGRPHEIRQQWADIDTWWEPMPQGKRKVRREQAD